MAKGIRIHPKFGLNPTLCTCFYCGKETGEIALLGASCKDEAPRHTCVSLEPCGECKKRFKDSVLLVEATRTNGDPAPTGRWLAAKKECLPGVTSSICYISPEDYNFLVGQAAS